MEHISSKIIVVSELSAIVVPIFEIQPDLLSFETQKRFKSLQSLLLTTVTTVTTLFQKENIN